MTDASSEPALQSSYRQRFEEVGRQLPARRAGTIHSMVHLFWPFVVLILFAFSLQFLPHSTQGGMTPLLALATAVLFVCGAFAAMRTGWLLFCARLETLIWINAYFDGKKLSLRESAEIAKRLSTAAHRTQVTVECHYYILPLLLWLFLLFFLAFTSFTGRGLVFLVVLFGTPFLLLAYVREHVKFVPQLFLDFYGLGPIPFHEFIAEHRQICTIQDTTDMHQALRDSFHTVDPLTLRRLIREAMEAGMRADPRWTQGRISHGSIRSADAVARVAVQCILYRHARAILLDGKKQPVNKSIYMISATAH